MVRRSPLANIASLTAGEGVPVAVRSGRQLLGFAAWRLTHEEGVLVGYMYELQLEPFVRQSKTHISGGHALIQVPAGAQGRRISHGGAGLLHGERQEQIIGPVSKARGTRRVS